MTDLDRDHRWKRLMTKGAACSCGERHVGLLTLTMIKPAGWEGPDTSEPDSALRMHGDFLSENFSVREGKYFAMRMSLPIAIKGASGPAALLSVWASLDRPDFEAYLSTKLKGQLDPEAKTRARLVNRISGYPDTFGLMGAAFQQTDGPPLLLVLNDPDAKGTNHPLIADQRQGIDFDRLLEIYVANGHDFRRNLTN